MTKNHADRNRVRAGVSTGGQFAAEHRRETDVALPRPASVKAILEGTGDTGGYTFYGTDSGSPIYGDLTIDEIDIVPALNDDEVLASVTTGVYGAYESLNQAVPGGIADDDAAAREWIDNRSHVIEAWLQDEYGITEFEEHEDDGLDAVRVAFDVTVPADTLEDDLVDAVHARSKVAALYKEQDHGAFGTRNMWDHLARHLIAHEHRVQEASGHYAEAALWMSEEQLAEDTGRSDWSTDDLSPGAARQMEEEVSAFLIKGRHALDQAREQVPGYSDEQAGHDFWLTGNRHGAGFWERGLGGAGQRLTDLAHSYGEVNVVAGDDGLLHFE